MSLKDKLFYFFIFLLTVFCFSFVLFPIVNTFLSVDLKALNFALRDGEVWRAILTSVKGAFFSTLLGLLMGVPTAYFLVSVDFKAKSFFESLLNLPIVIPHVAVGIMILKLLNQDAFLGKAFATLGISFVDTIYGIIVAMCFVSFSYAVTSSILGFKSVEEELVWTARTLGASPFQVFRYIMLPLAFPYILRGAILSFARSMSEVGALLIVACYPITAPILMYERFEDYGLKASMPIAVLVILISLLIFVLLLSLSGRRGLDVKS